MLHCMEDAASHGLTARRARLRLVSMRDLPAPQAPPATPASVRAQVESAMQVTRDGRPVKAVNFRPEDLLMPLLRRTSLLYSAHAGAALASDFAGLRDAARQLCWLQAQWVDSRTARYSSRQQRRVPIAGVVGRGQLDGARLSGWWPLLWLGQYLHVGKGAAMGMGCYQLQLLDASAPGA